LTCFGLIFSDNFFFLRRNAFLPAAASCRCRCAIAVLLLPTLPLSRPQLRHLIPPLLLPPLLLAIAIAYTVLLLTMQLLS
jgi:hypothetical protein